MTRRTALAALALLLLLALLLGFWFLYPRDREKEEVAAPQGQESEAPGQDAAGTTAPQGGSGAPSVSQPGAAAEAPESTGAGGAATPADAKEEPPASGPSFDVVRVERSGETVIAGRAEPGAEVTVTSDGKEIGKGKADARGEFVILPDQPLPSGDHELAIVARGQAGATEQSQQVVVVSVPEGADKAAGETAAAEAGKAAEAAPREPLAVILPRAGEGEARVLQGGGSGIVVGDFALESILYDEAGRLTVSGRVRPEGRVFTYVDQAFVGEVLGSRAGRWSLAVVDPIAVGLHRLRIDHVDETGKVLARIETPFARSQLIAELPEKDRFVVVQPGNSLWRIARRVYGQGLQYGVIFEANRDQIRNPDLIYPGQIFAVPDDG